MIEVSLSLLIVALIAALALPRLISDDGGLATRVAAYRIAALLRLDRAAAEREGRTVITRIDVDGRAVRSGAGAAMVSVGGRYPFGLSDGGDAVSFRADGRASAALVLLAADREGYGVRVNAATGAVDVVRVRP